MFGFSLEWSGDNSNENPNMGFGTFIMKGCYDGMLVDRKRGFWADFSKSQFLNRRVFRAFQIFR